MQPDVGFQSEVSTYQNSSPSYTQPEFQQQYQLSNKSNSGSAIPILNSIIGSAASIFAISQQAKAAKGQRQQRGQVLNQRQTVKKVAPVSMSVLVVGSVLLLGVVYAISKKKD